MRRAERLSIFPHQSNADWVFDSSLVYEPSVLREQPALAMRRRKIRGGGFSY